MNHTRKIVYRVPRVHNELKSNTLLAVVLFTEKLLQVCLARKQTEHAEEILEDKWEKFEKCLKTKKKYDQGVDEISMVKNHNSKLWTVGIL